MEMENRQAVEASGFTRTLIVGNCSRERPSAAAVNLLKVKRSPW